MYTIGQIAKLFGLSRSALLYYDEIGILSPSERSPSNYRLYSDDDARKMEKIKVYREAGLSMEAIRSLLCGDSDSFPAILDHHLQELSREIAKLRHQQRFMGGLIGSAQVLQGCRSLTKDQWVALFKSSGMSRDEMNKWHTEFEKNFPDAHQDFLEYLGIHEKEIMLIRKISSEELVH